MDVAVSTGRIPGPDCGGVYVTVVAVAPERVPHAGMQSAPLTESDQSTPLFVESFCTVAVTTKGLAVVFTVENLFVMITARAAEIVKLSESDLLLFATDVAVSV